MNYTDAKKEFEHYLDGYDRNNDKVRLKIIHTYGVVHDMEDICRRMNLSLEDTELAKIIALLHDIGRFEQLKRFDSFEPATMDHAAYGVQVLFEEGMIRRFVPENQWDDIIRTAIALHSNFKLENISNPRTLLHARLIRDADKLDNCRVKLEDDLPVFMGMSGEDIGAQTITPKVYDTVLSNQCIYSPDRVTKNGLLGFLRSTFLRYLFPRKALTSLKNTTTSIKLSTGFHTAILIQKIKWKHPHTSYRIYPSCPWV